MRSWFPGTNAWSDCKVACKSTFKLGAANTNKFDERDHDILLEDPAVSKSHAMIFAHPHGLSVADLMSTNGIKVNGQTVNDASLKPGDRLRIGKTLLLFDDTGRA